MRHRPLSTLARCPVRASDSPGVSSEQYLHTTLSQYQDETKDFASWRLFKIIYKMIVVKHVVHIWISSIINRMSSILRSINIRDNRLIILRQLRSRVGCVRIELVVPVPIPCYVLTTQYTLPVVHRFTTIVIGNGNYKITEFTFKREAFRKSWFNLINDTQIN